jgi:uncharacterized protein
MNITLKPWREIARPHTDVLEGSFKQSEFAADISQVASGTAPEEYQDPEKFFSRTYITEGMRLLLISVAQRLTGRAGDPVVQLQTAFGGGKTHTMLAVMHLAQKEVSTEKLEGIPPILDEADINELPAARIAVIDGINLSPSHPQNHGIAITNTLWGELAWQLLGDEGYAMVAESDEDGTSPGKEVVRQILEKASPCIVLIDELLAFIRQLESGRQFKAGTFDSNMSFIQALTEAMKLVPNAMLLASLPESELEVGGAMGQRTLNSLEKCFARVESVWKPVASTEAFEIVRRRLFEYAGDSSQVETISRQFFDYYRANSEKFPIETQANDYFERLCQSYPIHPEIFDRLYEDWSTLDKFQRTRGVLQYMAIVIHRLWNSDNCDALIMPGSIDLDDNNVRNKSIHYLPQGWEPVIEKEVDGPRSQPCRIDGRDTRFGSVQAAHRSMRTIFMGSAPVGASQMVKGLLVERILLGCAQPGQTVGVFEDVLRRLRDRLQYLYSDGDRFWLDTKPNLRREMESRKKQIDTREKLIPLIKDRVRQLFGIRHCFSGIHVFTPSSDVPDDFGTGPRLVVLPPDIQATYSKADPSHAINTAEKILRNRGDQPRQKQNRLLFFAADYDVLSRLKDYGRTYIAWKEILSDIDAGKLNLDLFQINQAKKHKQAAEKSLQQIIREAYKWILCPVEDFVNDKPKLLWEAVVVSTLTQDLSAEIGNILREEEWLISEWSPIHLRNHLQQWYFKDGVDEINALKVWQDSCSYLYMPRLLNDQVFKTVIDRGLESGDFFGFASGKEKDQYLGFAVGTSALITLDDSSLIIEREAAIEYLEKVKQSSRTQAGGGSSATGQSQKADMGEGPRHEDSFDPKDGCDSGAPHQSVAKKQFYGTVDLNPVTATMSFSDIVNEVVQHFTSKIGVEVAIKIEVEAKSSEGFDEALQRTVKENCSVLKFTSAEFEE